MTELGSFYTPEFYADYTTDTTVSDQSAGAVLDMVFQLYRPGSLLDIGCGPGTWLVEASRQGVDILGVDGDWVPPDQLRIPAASFQPADLSQPLDLGRRFDMVMSLDVAEHLPAEHADTFVDSVTRHADLVLFSAAVPKQGGTHHVNEQWPQYWKEKFEAHGFELFDVLRSRLWDDDRVYWWYRQNVLVYAKGHAAETIRTAMPSSAMPLALVHPGKVMESDFGEHKEEEPSVAVLARHSRALLKRVAYSSPIIKGAIQGARKALVRR